MAWLAIRLAFPQVLGPDIAHVFLRYLWTFNPSKYFFFFAKSWCTVCRPWMLESYLSNSNSVPQAPLGAHDQLLCIFYPFIFSVGFY